MNSHNQLPLTQDKKITLQEYASRWGLGFLTFPEDGDDDDDDDGDDDGTSDHEEVFSDADESDTDMVDPSLPKSRRRMVKLGP